MGILSWIVFPRLAPPAESDPLGAGVRVLSQPRLVADSLADYLQRRPNMIGPGTGPVFLTTGKPRQVSDRATQFLRRRIEFQAA